jgi:uncharacterized protein
LLRRVSGLNQTTAKNLHEWRTTHGRFTSRKQFLEVPGFGEAAYVQAVGFLKITDGIDPLDATWIHPESYDVATKVLERLGGSPADLVSRQQLEPLAERTAAVDLDTLAAELGVGRLLLADILEQLQRPGRDPREDLPLPFFKKGVLKLEDLELGMELHGAVLNVVDFGAFVDIGLHDSGLVHISQLSSRYVRDPHDVVSVGEIVRVWVLELDKARRRVALTMISPAERARQQAAAEQRKQGRGQGPERGPRQGRGQGQGGQRRREGESGRAGGPAQAGGQPRPAVARPATGAGEPPAGGRSGGSRPPKRRGGRDERQPREYQPRVYEAKQKKEQKPLTDAMRQGKEPLRTFGDLRQFLSRSEEPPVAEPPAEPASPPAEPPASEEPGTTAAE